MIRMTNQRRAILDALKQQGNHPTADEVYKIVRRRLPRISLGTIYRNLEIMADEGLVQKFKIGQGPFYYDSELKEHYHIRCLKCEKIDDVMFSLREDLDRTASLKSHYQVLGHSIQFHGYCPGCKKFMKNLLKTKRR